jgi:hypothetical protein
MHSDNDSRSGGRKCRKDAVLHAGVSGPEFVFVTVTQLRHSLDLGESHEVLLRQHANQSDSITRPYTQLFQVLRCLPISIDLPGDSERIRDRVFHRLHASDECSGENDRNRDASGCDGR